MARQETQKTHRFLALDMGAESGRGVVGALDADAGRVTLREVHRFANEPVRLHDTLYWDLPRLHAEQVAAITRAVAAGDGAPLSGVGVDTWGVDFGLIGDNGALVGLPVHYRDARTNGMMDKVFARVPRPDVFAQTGIQMMPINTLFQLAAVREQQPALLDAARTLLFVPDLLHYYLCGRAAPEFTIATTSQLYDGKRNDWARGLLAALDLPARLFAPVVPDGTEYGVLLPHVAEATGAGPVPVIAPAGHDTACAVAAVPVAPSAAGGWAYLSSGTWSLLGVETVAPVVNEATLAHNFTNEGGACGTWRLLKNIAGLWLVQECRRALARNGGPPPGYDELAALARAAPPLVSVFDPDDPSLLAPADMPQAVRTLCQERGEPIPNDIGPLIRACLDSLALKYRATLEALETITGQPIHTLHIVGGGSQNTLLNQLAADATGRPVVAGPVEATALGNVLLQARTRGLVGSLADLRAIVRASFPVTTCEPDPAGRARFDEAYQERFAPRVL